MDKDYENFVGRMGSFEDVIDLDGPEKDLERSGKELVDELLHSMGDTIMFEL